MDFSEQKLCGAMTTGPKKVSQVEEQFSYLNEQIKRLENKIVRLEDVLNPILLPICGDVRKDGLEKPKLVPLADGINICARDIERHSDRISTILGRLEL